MLRRFRICLDRTNVVHNTIGYIKEFRMSIVKEFKEFAVKGNVIDLAVGVIIGAAFGKIVASLVEDIFMPIIGIIVGGVNFTNLKLTLVEAAANAPAVTLNYGKFLQQIFDFTIVAFAIFMFVKGINSLKRAEAAAPAAAPEPTTTEKLLAEIRDSLKK